LFCPSFALFGCCCLICFVCFAIAYLHDGSLDCEWLVIQTVIHRPTDTHHCNHI
jgi:hypothetical protein